MMSQDDKNTSVFPHPHIDRSNWKRVRLGDVCDLKNGYAFESKSYVSRGKYFVITIANVQDGRFVIGDETNKINSMPIDVQKHQILKNGNLLISMTGNVGRVCVVDRNDCLLNQRVGLLDVNNTVDKTFVYYRLQHFDFQQKMISAGKGGAQPNIGKHDILGFEFDLPEMPEQKAISKSFSCINNLIFSLQNLVFKYEAIKKATVNLLLAPRENWRQIRLGDIGEVSMCKRILKSQTSATGDVPFFKIGTFGKQPDAFISRTLFEDFKRRFSYPKVGDVLLSAAGTIGRTVVFNGENAYFQDSNIVWIANDESIISNPFLNVIYSQINWQTENGGTVSRLYNANIQNTIVSIPNLDEQKRIVKILDSIDDTIIGLRAQLEKSQSIKQGMMTYFFG